MLLFLIFSVAFLIRVAVIFYNEFPPSSDIGLHSSIINLILDKGELPLWNPYHMGGEPLVTPPGFHIFVSTLILFTGMPLLFSQLITAAFFSAFIIFPAYLMSKRIWRSQITGIIAAFFAAISALSLEMISWGGYPNVISLALIIIIFYLFIRDTEQPSHLSILIGSIIFGSIILTHSFSLFVFFPILIVYFVFLFIGRLRKIKEIKLQKPLFFFTKSVAAGILLVSPWILRVLNFYIGASSEAFLLGGLEENKNLILANRSVDSVVLVLVIILIQTFIIFKSSRKHYIDNVSLLFVAWFLVPLIMTQSHIFGIFIDYPRFPYFMDFPGILIISASLFYFLRIVSSTSKYSKIKPHKVNKILLAIFAVSLNIFIILSPWSIYPSEAVKRANFYTTIQRPEAAALGWIQDNTLESSVFAADHLYGWWLSGVGKRPTLSATGLEFLLYLHEIEVAKSAQLLLDTDYYIDNGLIQVRDDGIQISLRNTEFSIETWGGESYPLFNIQDNGIEFYYGIEENENDSDSISTLADMITVETPTLIKGENSANLTMTFGDDLFTIKKTVAVWRGVRFAELSYDIEVKNSKTNLNNISLSMYTRQGEVLVDPPIFGFYDPNQKVCGQVIFKENDQLQIDRIEDEPTKVRMLFSQSCARAWKRKIKITMLIGVFEAKDLSYPTEVEEIYYNLATSPLEVVTLDPLVTFDYIEMLEEYDVSYVVSREEKKQMKFVNNSNFRVLYNCGNVRIFQVIK